MMCPLSPQGASQKLKWVSICFRSGDISILKCQVVSWVWPLPVVGFTCGRSRLKACTQISGGRHWFHVSRTFLSGSIARWTSRLHRTLFGKFLVFLEIGLQDSSAHGISWYWWLLKSGHPNRGPHQNSVVRPRIPRSGPVFRCAERRKGWSALLPWNQCGGDHLPRPRLPPPQKKSVKLAF